MENLFYHIKWPPLNVTIFITQVCNLRKGCYTNAQIDQADETSLLFRIWLVWHLKNFWEKNNFEII